MEDRRNRVVVLHSVESCDHQFSDFFVVVGIRIYPNKPITVDLYWLHTKGIKILESVNLNSKDFIRSVYTVKDACK